MGKYIVKRFIMILPSIFGVSVLVFMIMRLLPGDPASIMLGTSATPENLQALRHVMNLDQPLVKQYINWSIGLFQGDFGVSVRTGNPILPEILQRFPVTLQLTVFAAIIGWTIGIPVGIFAAVRANTAFDVAGRVGAMLGISVPSFSLGTLLLLVTSLYFGWFPPIDFYHFWENPLEAFKVFILPATTMGIALAASVMRITRSSFLEILDKDFMRTARAKGNSEWRVVIGHGLRNAAVPIVTIVGIQMGILLGGAVIMEQLFSIPGLGQYVLEAIYQRDYPVVQGGVLFISIVLVFVNLMTDIIYGLIDPRIKYE